MTVEISKTLHLTSISNTDTMRHQPYIYSLNLAYQLCGIAKCKANAREGKTHSVTKKHQDTRQKLELTNAKEVGARLTSQRRDLAVTYCSIQPEARAASIERRAWIVCVKLVELTKLYSEIQWMRVPGAFEDWLSREERQIRKQRTRFRANISQRINLSTQRGSKFRSISILMPEKKSFWCMSSSASFCLSTALYCDTTDGLLFANDNSWALNVQGDHEW